MTTPTITELYAQIGAMMANWQRFLDQQMGWQAGPSSANDLSPPDNNPANKGYRVMLDAAGNKRQIMTPSQMEKLVADAVKQIDDLNPASLGAQFTQVRANLDEITASLSSSRAELTALVDSATSSKNAAASSATAASSSKTAAASSATAAASSATAAASSATSASSSKTAAASSATAAAASQGVATTKASESQASAAESANKAADAAVSASTASTKASEAATSAATASTKAGEAAASATTASTKAGEAAASATAAATSATAAKTSETNANTKAIAAASSAVTSQKWADNAVDSAVTTGKFSALHHATKASESAAAAAASANTSLIKASEASGHASSASTSASTATTKAGEAATGASTATAKAAAAASSATSAASSATAAGNSATAAANSATAAANSASSASSSKAAAASSAADAAASAQIAREAMYVSTGALMEAGEVNMSSGAYPTPLTGAADKDLACFWKVTTAGVSSLDGVDYEVGDTLVYSSSLKKFYKIDNTESVQSVNGMKGAVRLTAADVGALGSGATAVAAAKLATARTISITGDGTGSASFDGTGNVSISLAVTDDSHAHTFANLKNRPTTLAGYGITDAAASDHAHADLFQKAGGVITGLTQINVASGPTIGGATFDNGWLRVGTSAGGIAIDSNEIMASGHELLLGSITSHGIGLMVGNVKAGAVKADGLYSMNSKVLTEAAGSAVSAGKLATARALALTGDATGSLTFDGSADASMAVTLADSGVTAGTFTKVTVDAKGRVTAATTQTAADIPALDWSKITSGKPTNLTGYGISSATLKAIEGLAMAADKAVYFTAAGTAAAMTVTGAARALLDDADSAAMRATLGAASTSAATTTANGLMSAADKAKLDSVQASANAYVHPASGVAAGSYRTVTVDANGHVTGGSNPTTLNDYGITDALGINANAVSATKLATARTLTVGGTGKAFDGTANLSWSLAEIGAVKDNAWYAQVKLGTWSAICELQVAGTLGGKAIVTVGHTRGNVVVNAMFLVSFGHAGHASITQLESHGYTQIKVRPAMTDVNNIRLEILDDTLVAEPMGSVVTYTVRVDNLFGSLFPFTAFTASTGTPKVEVSTEWQAIKVNNNKAYHEGFKPTSADVGLGQVVNAPQIQSVFANGYWGMVASTGNAAEWIRTPQPGIIPYTSGGYSSLGTIAWPFLDAHVGTVYEGGRSLAEKYLSLTGGQLSNGLTIANSSGSSNLLSLLNEGDGWTWIKFGKSANSAGQGHFAWSTLSVEGHPVNAFHLRPGGSSTTLSVARDVVTLRRDVPLDFQGNSTWGGKLRVGGNGRTAPDDGLMASVVSSNGNLHLDSASGKELYLNHYVGESIVFGDGAKGVVGRITKDGDFSVNRNGAFGGTLSAKSICTGWDSGVPGAVSCSNWFRSSGDSGWYNDTYSGGIHMQDSTWVRIFNAKKFHVANADNDSIYTLGGVKADKGFIGDLTGNARSATFLNGQSSSAGVTSLVNRLNSGFYEVNQATQANGWPVDGGWYHMMCATHSNGDNYYSMQFAADFNDSNNLFYRATSNNGLTVWNRVWHSGNFDPVDHGHTIGSVAGLQSALNAKADCPGGSISFGGNPNAITTAQFIELLTSLGAFSSSGYWTARGSWAYAYNQFITDTGLGSIHLAGAVVEVIGPSSAYTIRITTPTTASVGLVAAEFIYVNNGSDYAPGWRRSFNTSNPPTAAQVGALPVNANAVSATKLATARAISATGDATGSASFDGSANAAIALTLANSGVTAGTYGKVTVDAKGRVTAGLAMVAADIPSLDWSKISSGKPTTLAGYGITDAAPSSHVSSGGGAHATATTAAHGFMSSTDKAKLDSIASNANNYAHPTGDGNLHVPATGTGNNGKVLMAGATAGSLSWQSINADVVGAVPVAGGSMSGALTVNNEIRTTSANSMRMVYGNYGTFWRQDGANMYLMFTNAGDQYGGYNSLRPMYANLANGNVNFGHSVDVNGNLFVNTGSTSWIDMRSSAALQSRSAVVTASASAIVRQEHADRHFILGGLGNSCFGVFMINKSRTANGTDAGAYLSADGTWYCGGNVSANDYQVRSDRRLKSEFTEIKDAWELWKSLQISEYTKQGQREYGFIAQDFEKNHKPAIAKTMTDDYLNLKPMSVLAIAGKVIQSLQDRVENLENALKECLKRMEVGDASTS